MTQARIHHLGTLAFALCCATCSLPAQAEPAAAPCVCQPPAGASTAATPAPDANASSRPRWRIASWSALPGWGDDDLAQAWPALRVSCQALGEQKTWQSVCAAAKNLPTTLSTLQVRQFLEQRFTPWQVVEAAGGERGLVTGYYEPLIRGSRERTVTAPWPIYAPPADMLSIELSGVYPELKRLRLRGRLDGNKVVPYWTREELEQHQDQLPAQVLLWASDPIDLFFLQVQGSGRVELPDGRRVRIGYADQNGHPYQSIGRWLIKRGELSANRASVEGIRQWVRKNPRRLGELLNANPSYVFFRELPDAEGGPIGSQGTPIFEGRSIAIDPAHVPLGAPVFLSTTWPNSPRPLNRLVLAQDTGSAIKGAVRADFFWGFGPEAGAQAGKMRQQGQMWVLLPRGATPAQL
ncbi:membrane protein [Betaproteobacteria bacterium]|nr:membrane protein [Betaproteobacteria bacterium]GHT94411.1 membrane protein [Betaproteobacteria bacterium]GHU03582.1 membrane protein [Betaproteobacteria bacterium]GHU11777.1 membrane protein [Betaproteobacteria bacterium]GHU22263.1 membrane protein [Betaproteobacteria bacterium]